MRIVHDPGLVHLRRGARAAVVVPLLYAGTNATVGTTAALYASFGAFASMAFADFQGPARRRLEGYGVLAVLGAVLILVGSWVAELPVLVPTLTILAVAFAIRFVGCLGGYAIAAGTTLMLAFALAVMTTPVEQVDQRTLGWLLGCAAAAGASMVAALPRRSIARDRLAAQSRALAAHLRDRAAGRPTTAPDVVAVRQVREELAVSSSRPLVPALSQAALGETLDALGRATILCAHLDPDTDLGADGVGTDRLAEAAADAFEAAARVIADGGGYDPAPAHAALVTHRERTVTGLTATDPDRRRSVEDAAATAMRLRIVTSLAALCASAAALWQGQPVEEADRLDVSVALPEPGARGFWHRARRTLRFHLRWESTRFRNSLRAGVAVAAALVVARAVAFDHAFWVVLGTLMVLRSGASDTTTTALQALRGTLIGFVIAVPIAVVADGHDGLLWVLLPLVAFLSAWAPGAVGLGSGQAAFTVFVVVLFNLAAPAGAQTAVLRVETVATGIAVATVAGFLFWPRGPRATLGPLSAQLYRAAAALLRAVSADALALGHPAADRAAARQALGQAREQVEETLREVAAVEEGAIEMPRRLALLTTPALVEAGDWSRADLAGGTITPAEGVPDAPPVEVEAQAFEVAGRLDEVASSLAVSGATAVAFDGPAARGRGRPEATGRDPAEFLRLVWLWTWLGIVDDATRRTSDDALAAVRPTDRRWWR